MASKDNPARPKYEAFTRVLEEFFDEGNNHPVGYAIIHSDEDLVEMLNDRLPEEDRIDVRTFRRYKAGEIKDDGVLERFVSCYKRALKLQAKNLFEKLEKGDPGSWQKYAWIIERKFDSWNLRQKAVDETPVPKQLVFRVTSGDVLDTE